MAYINAAFRSSRINEVYLFVKNEYVLVNYAPGTKDDKTVLLGLIIRIKHSSGNLCAQINYAPHTANDRIITRPMTITAMFPFFKGTVFENGVDTAFESTKNYEAYLFKDNQYALINYDYDSHLISIRLINRGFPSLKNTIFESGIDAGFSLHKTNEAYLFKGDYYARINFAPGTTDDYITGGIKKILTYWPSLRSILPLKNSG
ncbi:unnamed protein product [Ilex paraguariensis]|uniref:Uncharacterized protein n=1 Tax=Ilex paraguariensis TaxID=185542 RepID=A0ABC8S542_9AQUA